MLQCLRPQCLLSRFPPRVMLNRDIHLVRLLSRTDAVATGLSQKLGDIRPLLQTVSLVPKNGIPNRLSCFSPQKAYLECFADNNNIPQNPPTVFHPDWTAIAPQMFLLSLHVRLILQSHVFLICVVLTYNDSRKILHRTCQIPCNCRCK